jgi:putative PIN family toxin of toxin-antitoxin system
VLDANIVTSAVCWNGSAWQCFIGLARRRFSVFGTAETLREAKEIAARVIQEQNPPVNAANRLAWYLEKVKLVEPAPLGKQRSRDAKDDPYLAAALAARADIVTYDKDLLDLGKPFGVEVLRPAEFLNRFRI